MRRKKIIQFTFSILLLTIFTLFTFPVLGDSAEENVSKVGPVKMNPHPNSLEGKTVLLRWNGKYNGDKFLSRVAEMLMHQVKNIKIIKMWEVDPSTAVISKKMEVSEQLVSKIAKLNPDIVIAAQAD